MFCVVLIVFCILELFGLCWGDVSLLVLMDCDWIVFICWCIIFRVFLGYVRWIGLMLVGEYWIGVFGEGGLIFFVL